MNVAAEATVALPTRLRPTPAQVCNWYERTLWARGATVWRTAPDQLEFAFDISRTFFDANLKSTLAPLATGELEVTETADGFEVSARARPRIWLSYLPFFIIAGAVGSMAYVATPIYLPALAGAALIAVAWLRSRAALNRFLESTNEEITRSFAAMPPTPHGHPN